MSVSKAQQAANQANAQHSTGPRTEAGKKVSRMNAVRHAITSQLMLLPEPQMRAYLDFNQQQQHAWAPANAIEKQLVQTIIDTQFRMNSSRTWEMGLFAETHQRCVVPTDTESPEVQDAMAAMRVLTDKADQLRLLSLYEQRLNRTLQVAIKQIREIQAERKQRQAVEMQQAAKIVKLYQMKGLTYNPAENGFDFSTRTFELYNRREQDLHDAEIAESAGYNLNKYEAAVAKR